MDLNGSQSFPFKSVQQTALRGMGTANGSDTTAKVWLACSSRREIFASALDRPIQVRRE